MPGSDVFDKLHNLQRDFLFVFAIRIARAAAKVLLRRNKTLPSCARRMR